MFSFIAITKIFARKDDLKRSLHCNYGNDIILSMSPKHTGFASPSVGTFPRAHSISSSSAPLHQGAAQADHQGTSDDADTYSLLANARVLIVDDDMLTGELVSVTLADRGAVVKHVTSIKEYCAVLGTFKPEVVLVDINLPDGDGREMVARTRDRYGAVATIFITGYPRTELAHWLEENDFPVLLTKPFSKEQLIFTVSRELARIKRKLASAATAAMPDEMGLVGRSDYLKKVRDTISLCSSGIMPVLIQGPTGTGKEIIARSIHSRSRRVGKPMIIVNSSAIPEHLEESEFFGHARGAFTGANETKMGLIESACGSTLFLDEVGELSLRIQAKLLRVLDGHDFCRIGETTPVRSSFRLISATNRALPEMIETGAFRQDLYFRLRASFIETIPLSRHAEDIPVLIDHWLRMFSKRDGNDYRLSGPAIAILCSYSWPGNVRELRNAIDSLCAMASESGCISTESVSSLIASLSGKTACRKMPFASAKIEFERSYYRELLTRHGGNITSAASEASLERAYLSKRVKLLGLNIDEFRAHFRAMGSLTKEKTPSAYPVHLEEQ